MNNIPNYKKKKKIILVLLLLFISLGYAVLNANLKINGTSKINNSRWDVHWNNVQVTNGSVSIGTGDAAAAIKQNDSTEVNYTVTLNKPGDFYEFTIDAVNAGTVDAMIDVITSTYKIGEGEVTEITSNNLPSYLTYSVTYSDNKQLLQNHYLKANTTEKYKVRIEYKKDIENNELVESEQSIAFGFSVDYKQADSNAIEVRTQPVSFADDDWDTIINAVQDGNLSKYHVGDTKEIYMGSYGTHVLRISNTTFSEECYSDWFSQTACGFVLEFADIIDTRGMNSSNTAVGGWPASDVRTYVNNDIYEVLPTELKNAIIDTTVVSGHGRNDNNNENFISTDKLYLLSTKEVGYDANSDTAKIETRALDYYLANNNDSARKKGTSSYSGYFWWLRSPASGSSGLFFYVDSGGGGGSTTNNPAGYSYGVSPAFRLKMKIDPLPTPTVSSPSSFDSDSWATIINAVQNNNISAYHIGDTKTLSLGRLGSYTIRVANNSTPEDCSIDGFSQTACGFVLEFADIIDTRGMNSSNTAVGGWLASDVRTYVNNDIYNALPSLLKESIIDTTVVSGHGRNDNNNENFISVDKLYLLSTKEVGFDVNSDTAKIETRTLDYYLTNNNDNARKKGTNSYSGYFWWLRSPASGSSGLFFYVDSGGGGGSTTNNPAGYSYGVSPAFRLG